MPSTRTATDRRRTWPDSRTWLLHRFADLVVDRLLGSRTLGLAGGTGSALISVAGRQLVRYRHRVQGVAIGRFIVVLDRLGRADHLAFRIEDLGTGGDAVEVQLGGHLRPDLAETQRARQQILDDAGRPLLVGQLLLVGVRLGVGVAAIAQAARQQVAAVVDDGDLVRFQLGNRRRDQVLDRHDLLALQLLAGAQLQENAGGRGLLGAAEHLALGQHQMDARLQDRSQGRDRARQFPFGRAQMVDALDEAGRAEAFRLVIDLVADRAAGRQSRLGHHHPKASDLIGRHHDPGAIGINLMRDLLLFELADDGAPVLGVQVAVKQGHVRRGQAGHQVEEETDQPKCYHAHGGKPYRA